MDEQNADIYYVDTRNADHRHSRPMGAPWFRPRIGPPTRTVYVPPGGTMPYQPQVIYASPPPSGAAALLGRLTTGQIIEMVAQVFAAVQSLPGSPVATKDLETDVANLILYQGALASHAKRDEQVRTLGSLVAKLVG